MLPFKVSIVGGLKAAAAAAAVVAIPRRSMLSPYERSVLVMNQVSPAQRNRSKRDQLKTTGRRWPANSGIGLLVSIGRCSRDIAFCPQKNAPDTHPTMLFSFVR